MSIVTPLKNLVKYVILDLDGTLLNTGIFLFFLFCLFDM